MASYRFLACLAAVLCSLFAVSADDFLSIDCGSLVSYKDESGIVWTADSSYVGNGEFRSVQPSNSFSRVMDTMRVFTTRRKNCYTIDSVSRGRVLLRAHFFYGNYDGRSSPPTFNLSFDGNDWATVVTSMTDPFYYEVIYVMKKDSISVCVARTDPGQFPFISAITVRRLELFSYQNIDFNHPLFMSRRVAFGSNATIRYPDDPYDRYWSSAIYANESSLRISSYAVFGQSLFLPDRPPPAALKNAITAINASSSIELFMRFPFRQAPVYINWYFSEVRVLKSNEIRSFRVFKDDKPYSPTIIPPYENCTEFSVSALTVSSSNTFSLVPNKGSTLPPLINAMEVFYVGDELTYGTNTDDVRGLASLQNAFSALRDWSGDPCLPSPFSWDWIVCNSNLVPRVTTLSLDGYGLSGLLPDFSSMDALTTINLHNNSLQGPIPEFLGRLQNLEILNLGNNQFTGIIPASLSMRMDLVLIVDGNPGLCTSCSTAPANSSVKKNLLEAFFAAIISSIIIILYFGETLL